MPIIKWCFKETWLCEYSSRSPVSTNCSWQPRTNWKTWRTPRQSNISWKGEFRTKIKERLISIEDIQESEQLCRFYTGFPNYRTFKALFDYLEDVAATKRSWRGKETISKHHFSERCQNKPGPDSKLTLEQEFLMVMMRLKVGLLQKDLGRRFGVSEATVSRVFTS